MLRVNGIEIKPTIFPDGTSQVWQLPEVLLDRYSMKNIQWDFESESEIIHLLQLRDLLVTYNTLIRLKITYLPYGRQDKSITNQSTFALSTFIKLIRANFRDVEILDAHNPHILPDDWENIIPNLDIKNVINKEMITIVCFPDRGASNRGYTTGGRLSFSLDKKRNQLTGDIEGLISPDVSDLKGHNVLIVDDLCDGGRTFIEAKKLLDNMGAESVSLYTTHGIYSKGLDVLKEAGFKSIYNYKGKVC